MKVTKLDAGIAQLKEAIYLFFEERDTISTHTLAGAASLLLFNIGEHGGVTSLVRGNPYVKTDKKVFWISKINEAQNFFKHADRDPESTLDFDPSITELLIFEGCLLVEGLTGDIFPEAKIFIIWFLAKHPDILNDGALKDHLGLAISDGLDVDDLDTFRIALRQCNP